MIARLQNHQYEHATTGVGGLYDRGVIVSGTPTGAKTAVVGLYDCGVIISGTPASAKKYYWLSRLSRACIVAPIKTMFNLIESPSE